MTLRDDALIAFQAKRDARLVETKEQLMALFNAWASRLGLAGAEPRIYWEKLQRGTELRQLVWEIRFQLKVEDLEFRGSYATGDADITVTLEGFHGGTIRSLIDLGAALTPQER